MIGRSLTTGEVSRSDGLDSGPRNSSAPPLTQCSPVPLPALGTQKILQGNGTSVGTVIVRQCPTKHRLMGKRLTCVVDRNLTRWEGESYCQPLSPFSDDGFHVAVVASILSVAVILLMSMAFITCCWVDCNIESEKKKQSLKETNNNNNNNSSSNNSKANRWRPQDHKHIFRCPQNFVQVPVFTHGWRSLLIAPLGNDYNQPLPGQNLHQNQNQYQYQNSGPSVSCGQNHSWTSPSTAPEPEVEQRCGRLQNLLSTEENVVMKSLDPAEEFSLRLMSV
ncbi:uncharacterized protein susd3 [Cynoglossus semilaevis]|uniref:uncharacterized protein susd3 n=1 Tax=Cynoglossus semilaevis TaxID=244447 RepID=UPI0004958712|nr:uncharacterized protein LOC103385549 [Cynoglossus semilaevis]